MTNLFANPTFSGVGPNGSATIPGWVLTSGTVTGATAGTGTVTVSGNSVRLDGPSPALVPIPGGVYAASFREAFGNYYDIRVQIVLGETVLANVVTGVTTPVTVTATVPADYAGPDSLTVRFLGAMGRDDITISDPSLTVVASGGPGGEPEPDNSLGAQIARFLGQPADASFVAQAEQHGGIVRALVQAYTRGGGFSPEPNPELEAVIVTASARLLANPEQVSTQVGSVSVRGGFSGFNLAELATLNRYRKRAA